MRALPMVSLLALACPALACCAPDQIDPSVDQPGAVLQREGTGAGPTLSFAADWSVGQSGPLTGGAMEVLHYDLARLPRCRATTDGVPAWAIVAYYNVGGGPASALPLPVTASPSVDVPFEIPFAQDLDLWFENSDDSGCLAWDSNFGQNFRFHPDVPPAPTAHFRHDFTTNVDGTPAAGQDFIIDYDISRLQQCRDNYTGTSWSVQLDYRIDNGPVQTQQLTNIYNSQRFPAPGHILAPAGSHQVELWFENFDSIGCHTWDSRYGANYTFVLH